MRHLRCQNIISPIWRRAINRNLINASLGRRQRPRRITCARRANCPFSWPAPIRARNLLESGPRQEAAPLRSGRLWPSLADPYRESGHNCATIVRASRRARSNACDIDLGIRARSLASAIMLMSSRCARRIRRPAGRPAPHNGQPRRCRWPLPGGLTPGRPGAPRFPPVARAALVYKYIHSSSLNWPQQRAQNCYYNHHHYYYYYYH